MIGIYRPPHRESYGCEQLLNIHEMASTGSGAGADAGAEHGESLGAVDAPSVMSSNHKAHCGNDTPQQKSGPGGGAEGDGGAQGGRGRRGGERGGFGEPNQGEEGARAEVSL